MSKTTDRPGWTWARQHAGLLDDANVDEMRTQEESDSYARVILNDEWRALVRAFAAGGSTVDLAFREADAVLRRLDEEVEGE